jgi:FlaA1/EpsC-like NDP-sugar epimerase
VIPINRHRIWQLVADAGLIALAWYLAFALRFDQGVPRYYDTLFRRTILIVVAIKLVVFVLFRFYDRWWRYVSIRDMWSAVRGVTAASLVASLTVYFFSPVAQVRLPRSVAVMDWLFLLGLIAGTRLLARTVIERPGTGRLVARGKEVLVVGAGDAGQLTIR